MDISVVSTSYNSNSYIEMFLKRTINLFEGKEIEFEIIIVDDGSKDESISKIKNLQKNLKNIVLIELSRNFGHHPAMHCGLKYAKGNLIFLIDSDLEEEPELFHTFYERLKKDNLDLVFGQQLIRRGGLGEKISGNIFYFFLEHFAGLKVPRNAITARLMTKDYLKSYLLFDEREFLLTGITELTGFNQIGIPITKKRIRKTKYTLYKKLQILVRAITNYSSRPLYLLFYSGLIISIISLIMILYIALNGIFIANTVPGWLTLVCLSWLGVGITILSNGIIAIYLKTIFKEVKKRPVTIIKRIHL